jgi:hypothetical protein
VFEVPVTVGVKPALWPPLKDALLGDKVIPIAGGVTGFAVGCSVRATDALLFGFMIEVAVKVTDVWAVRFEGAVYNPFTSVPTFGLNDQVTAVLVVPVTVAAKVMDCPAVNVMEPGKTETFTVDGVETAWLNKIVAVPTALGLAKLVAETVTCVSLGNEAGAM